MGIRRCSRQGCDEIMIDTYIDSIGYICNSCKSEFIDSLGDEEQYEFEIIDKLKEFMNRTKRKGLKMKPSEFFKIYDY